MTLYDQFNRPIESTKPPEDDRVLSVAPLMESARDYVSSGLTPKKLAAIFQEADGGNMGRQSELFDQIEEKDAHILAEIAKRKNVILDMDFSLTAASDTQRDLDVVEFIQKWMDNLTDWPETITSLQDAIGKGYSGLEINWDVSSGQAIPDAFEYIEQKRFLFHDASGLLTRIPQLITDEEMMGMEIPPWRVLFHEYGGKSGHPTRSGIFRVCTWMYLFKNYSIKDWMTFCELCGIPIRLGKYDSGASKEDKAALIRAISSIGTAAAGVISKNTEITFVENTGTGVRSDMFEKLARFCNGECSKAILGQTLTADSDGKGSYALGAVHDGIRTDLMKADGRAIARTIRHQLLRPLVMFNFGEDTPVPGYEATWDQPEDLKAKIDWVGPVMEQVPVGKKWFYSEFNVPIPEEGEETIGGTPVPGQPTDSVAAKSTPETLIAKMSSKSGDLTPRDTLDALAGDRFNFADSTPLVAQIASMLDQAGSLEEFGAMLAEAGGDLDKDELATRMARGLALADLAGRYDER